MKPIFFLCAGLCFCVFNGTASHAAGAYKCSALTSFGKMTLRFKNGRVSGGGYTFEDKMLPDGSVHLTFAGESAILGSDGTVTSPNGAKTGPHNCDMKKVHAALKA